MQQFSNRDLLDLRSRIDRIHDLLLIHADPAAAPGEGRSMQAVLTDQLSLSIRIRRMRKSHFGAVPMSGPVWDMMLDLMLATSNGRTLSASDLATGAGVPLSSGLRMIASLEAHGFAVRSIDERDRRRTIVQLTDSGAERMASYFEKMAAMLQSSRNAGE
jgi:DNA-binding MarR family transcriptional regulator